MEKRVMDHYWYAATAVGSGFVAFYAAAQTMLDPASTWLPAGVMVALVVTAVGATVKVVRLIDGIRGEMRDAKRERRKIARQLDINLEEDE